MTLEGLGEVLKGDSADKCAGKFLLDVDERTVKRAQTVSEDPHRCERKFKSMAVASLRLT